MNVRHEVAKQSHGNGENPNSKSLLLPYIHIQHSLDKRQGMDRSEIFCWSLRLEGFFPTEGVKDEKEHQSSQNEHRILQTDFVGEEFQKKRQSHREDTTAKSDQAVHQAKMALEIMTEDNKTRRVDQRAPDAVENAVGQVEVPELSLIHI